MNKNEYVYRDCKIKMSKFAMSNLMYATIMTHAGIPTTYGIGIYEYTREQNAYNMVDIKVHIHPSRIEEFENLANVKLNNPVTPILNNHAQESNQ